MTEQKFHYFSSKEYKQKKLKEIKEFLGKEGYKVLSDDYIDNKTDLLIQCPKGHVYKAKWINIQRGNRCKQCHIEKISIYNMQFKGKSREEFRKEMHDKMLQSLKEENYTYVEGQYLNNKSPYTVICPQGHKFITNANRWFAGKRCRECFKLSTKKTFEEIAAELEQEGCKLLEWNGSTSPMLYICSCGRKHKSYIKDFRKGARCPYCGAQKRKETMRLKKLELLKQIFKD